MFLWFLEEGTIEGLWCYCYLVPTWNLMCHVNNTSQIKFQHIHWIQDSLQIYFVHTKNDQTGDESRHPRHIYANPHDPIVCPIFALSLYLMTFGTPVQNGSRLLPGKDQVQVLVQ